MQSRQFVKLPMPEAKDLAIVILAAGGSSRLGSPKQLLLFKGKTLLQNCFDEARATVEKLQAQSRNQSIQIVAVLGANESLIRSKNDFNGVQIITNEQWSTGISSSIKAAVSYLEKTANIGAALFLLADVPHLDSSLLVKILDKYDETGACIVCSIYPGDSNEVEPVMGVPALFTKEMFPQLMKLKGDTGARKVIAANVDRIQAILFQEGAIDIDTPTDYKLLKSRSNEDKLL